MGEKLLRKDDLSKFCGDLLERLRRLLCDEIKKQGGVSGSSAISDAAQREMEFIVRGKNEEERKTTIIHLILSKAASAAGGGSGKNYSISKNVFIQVWGTLAQELFTPRTDGALGCVIC